MKEDILRSLEDYGLTDKQSKIYLASLELGQSAVTNIARRASVDRVNTYYLLGQLIEKGLISESRVGNKRVFLATDPRRMLNLARERVRGLQETLPELLALTNIWQKKPRIQIFEGKNGMAQILEDMLETMRKKPVGEREILEYVSPDNALGVLPETRSFIRRRIKNRIRLRWIAPKTALAEKFAEEAKSPKCFRKMRLVPADKFLFLTEMNIYGDKINLIGEKGQQIGIIIEHAEMAQTQREIFELAWRGAESYR